MTRPGAPLATRLPRTIALLVAFVAALLSLAVMFGATAASADVVNPDEPYRVSGNVQLDGNPLPEITLTVTGNGVDEDVVTTRRVSGRSAYPSATPPTP